MTTALHRERLDAVVSALLASGARYVVDLGCGDGELLDRLRGHAQFSRLLGIDIDERALAVARARLALDLFNSDERLQVRHGSFESSDWAGPGIDAAVLLETIEHVDPSRLSRVETAVFGLLAAPLVVVTTPNREYNAVHGLAPGERRHSGHRFEWTRAQFRHWCDGVAGRRGYDVDYRDIGPPSPGVGSSTQMAVFTKC